jgi:hypothetical protein
MASTGDSTVLMMKAPTMSGNFDIIASPAYMLLVIGAITILIFSLLSIII